MEHKGSKTLKTDRLILRAFTHEDAPAMFRNWANDPEVTKYLTWEPHGSIDVTEKLVRQWTVESVKQDNYQWAMVLRETGQPIGSISLMNISNRNMYCEAGYCMGKNWWGKGLMTEAMKAVLDFAFEDVGFHKVKARYVAENVSSGRVMEKCGMTYEGTQRGEHLGKDGQFHDIKCYSILKEDRK